MTFGPPVIYWEILKNWSKLKEIGKIRKKWIKKMLKKCTYPAVNFINVEKIGISKN